MMHNHYSSIITSIHLPPPFLSLSLFPFSLSRCKVENYEKSDSDRLISGLGIGNFLSAIFGGFGGCGLIPNTLLNGSAGGEGYASAISYASCLGLSVLAFAPVIGKMLFRIFFLFFVIFFDSVYALTVYLQL
jgi:hypothetical protein